MERADVLVEPKDGYGEYNDGNSSNFTKEQFAGIELSERG